MKNRSVLPLILVNAVILLFMTVMPVGAQDNGETPPLLAMLALMPDIPQVRAGVPTVSFADFEALYTLEGVNLLVKNADFETITQTIPLRMLQRIASGTPEVSNAILQGDRMTEVVGFNWFNNVNQVLAFGQLPEAGVILGGDFDAEMIGAALSARGFEETDMDGVMVWHRFEDGAVSISDREMADPFGGQIGKAVRIAVLPGYLANSPFWAITEAVVGAAQDTQPSLADDPDYGALAEAITAPEGLLVQAQFFSVADIGFLAEDPLTVVSGGDGKSPVDDYGPLPLYTLAVMADRQEADDQVHSLAVVYDNQADAEIAATELANRIRSVVFPPQNGENLVERFGATVESSVYASESTGKYVAVASVRYPMPESRIDADSGMYVVSGMMFYYWFNGLMRREFYLLEVTG